MLQDVASPSSPSTRSSQPPAGSAGPYRDPASPQTPRPRRRRAWWLAAAAVVVGLVWFVRGRHRRQAPRLDDAPAEMFNGARVFPIPEPDLEPATPLAPLLAADAPEQLAILEPSEGATNLRYGQAIRIRFNRPMVDGAQVGHALAASPVTFVPTVRGRALWSTRSTLTFEPEPGTWSRPLEARMHLSASLRSLANEALQDETERTVVFDATPRLLESLAHRRIAPSEPVRLTFAGDVNVSALPPHMMAYELSGGRRPLRFMLAARGRDDEGRSLVDLRLGRALEPGARFALVLTPMLDGEEGEDLPRTMEFELQPRPRIEGFVCPVNTSEAEQCETTSPAGRVLDIGEELRVFSSVALADLSPSNLRVVPNVANLEARVAQRLITLRGDWAPGQVYEVRLTGLRDRSGADLTRTPPMAVRSAGRSPEVRVRTGRLAFESDAAAELRFAAIHVETGSVEYAAVEPGSEFAALFADAPSSVATSRTEPASAALRPRWQWASTPLGTLAPAARANRWGRGAFVWSDTAAGRAANMALVRFTPERTAPVEGATSTPGVSNAFVQRTDLGVSALALDDGALVSVTSIARAQPIAGVEVTAARPNGTVIASATTDARGVAWIPIAQDSVRQPLAVRARLGADRAIVLVDPRSAISPNHLGVGEARPAASSDAPVAGILTDRGAYRPGDTIRAVTLVRTVHGVAMNAVTRGVFNVRLVAPNGSAAAPDVRARLDSFGSASVEVSIDRNVEPGEYRLDVVREGSAVPVAGTTVQVAEFRFPTMRVDLAPAPMQPLEGDTIRLPLTAAYLFGAPAAGLRVRWSLVRNGRAAMPARWENFVFAPVDAVSRPGTVESGELVLDGAGRTQLVAHVAQSSLARENATIEVEVRGRAGDVSSARRTFVTFPSTHEVGVHNGPSWLETGHALDVDAVVIDHGGEPVAGRAIEARVLREGWHSYWEWSAHDDDGDEDEAPSPEGSYQARRTHERQLVHRCALMSATTSVHCTYTPTRPGTYVLEATTRDAAGRVSTASRRVYVAGPDEHPDRDPPGAPLTVTPAQRLWYVGDRASVAFESPWPDADALLTVVRGHALHTERRRVAAGGSAFEFAVTAAMIPDAVVSVTLTRPRSGPPRAEVDLDAPDLRFGAAEIDVRAHATPLNVQLALGSPRVEPGVDVPVDLDVRDAAGQPMRARVVIYAVDEGVLRLTDYATPDPTSGMIPRHGTWFAFDDIRRSLVSRLEPLALPAPGGDGNAGAQRTLRDEREAFDPTALWMPQLTTDARGHVHTTFRVPNRPATYRVMALAWAAHEQVGRASSPLVATRPIVLRPSLPRVLTAGDTFSAVIFAHNPTDQAADADVRCRVDGNERAVQRLHVDAGADVRLVEAITAPDASEVVVHCAVDRAAGGDSFTARLPVLPRGRSVRAQSLGSVAGERSIELAMPAGAIPHAGRVALDIAPHPFIGLEAAVGSFESQPIADSEALGAELIALASLDWLSPDGSPHRLDGELLRDRATRAIERLLALQGSSGGFARYAALDDADPYTTAWAVHSLEAARRRGWSVPGAARARAIEALGAMARGTAFSDAYEIGASDQLAFALRVLTECARPESARATALYDQRERLTPFGAAQLALALPSTDRRRDALVLRATRAVLATRESERRDPAILRWYDTSARTLGAVLEAAARIDVGVSSARNLASRILRLRAGASAPTWGSSHETAFALEALAHWAQRFRDAGAVDASVTLDGVPLRPTATSGSTHRFEIALDRLVARPHALRVRTSRFAFYALSTQWIMPLGPADEIARGRVVAVHRTFETESGVPLASGSHVHAGDLVRVRLFVFTENAPPSFVTLRDRIAGGFEPVDDRMETTPEASLAALLGMGGDDDGSIDPRSFHAQRSLSDITRRAFTRGSAVFAMRQLSRGLREFTYGVRATTPGTFVIPPAQIEAAYAREFVGRSTAASLVVDP